MNKDLQKIMKKVDSVSKYIPSTEILSVIKDLAVACKEHHSVERDIAIINAKKEVLIKEMTMKYDLYYKVFAQIFNERGQAINKSFDIIDKGLKENDKELISMGLNSLSTVVASSPFGNLIELSKLLEGNKVIEI